MSTLCRRWGPRALSLWWLGTILLFYISVWEALSGPQPGKAQSLWSLPGRYHSIFQAYFLRLKILLPLPLLPLFLPTPPPPILQLPIPPLPWSRPSVWSPLRALYSSHRPICLALQYHLLPLVSQAQTSDWQQSCSVKQVEKFCLSFFLIVIFWKLFILF